MGKFIIALYILATSFALIFLKMGAKDAPLFQLVNGKPDFNINALAVLGGLLYVVSFILYTYLIAKYDLGYIIPLVTAFVYVIIFFASYFIFNEVFTALKITGIFLILTGIFLLSYKK